jgi:TetR/AcrR family transcriptional regulator, transcriptional repressor for nem operon
MAKVSSFDVREAALQAAMVSAQTHGYNALSFRDLAAEIGVKSPTLHYHFPTKADLAEALMERYCDELARNLEPYTDKPFEEAIERYIQLFKVGFDGSNKMCLAGMMSAEVTALPDGAINGIARFANYQTDWLKRVLAKKHTRMSKERLENRARAIVSALEGAMLMSRGHGGDEAAFDRVIDTYKATGLLS